MLQTYLILTLSSLIIGGGAGAAITAKILKKKEPVAVIEDKTSQVQQEIVLQLTDIDLLEVPCSNDFIEAKGDLLCREMFCRMMSRGIDSQTSGQECEQISNIANTQIIRDDCKDEQFDPEECYRLYRERK